MRAIVKYITLNEKGRMLDHVECWQRCSYERLHMHCWWKQKGVAIPKSNLAVLGQISICIVYGPAVFLLAIYSKEVLT